MIVRFVEKLLEISLLSFKWLGIFLLLQMAVSWIIGQYVTGCYDGAFSYGGCTYKGRDVSPEITQLSWMGFVTIILMFTIAAVSIVLYCLELLINEIGKT